MTKTTKKNDDRVTSLFEYVDYDVLSLLFDMGKAEMRQCKMPELLRNVRFIWNGTGRKFHFIDAARLGYPGLSDFEYAQLRIDINKELYYIRELRRLERKERKNVLEQEEI